MAKRAIRLGLTYYESRDPVTGAVHGHVRPNTVHNNAPRVLEQRKCVRQGMEGFRAKSDDPKENALAIRQKFTEVSRGCARGGGRRAG